MSMTESITIRTGKLNGIRACLKHVQRKGRHFYVLPFFSAETDLFNPGIIRTNYRYILAQDKFSDCKAEEWGVAAAESIDDNAADGNLD